MRDGGHEAVFARVQAAPLRFGRTRGGTDDSLPSAIAEGVPVVTPDCSPAIRATLRQPSVGTIAAAEPAAPARVLDDPRLGDAARRVRLGRHAAGDWLALLDAPAAAPAG